MKRLYSKPETAVVNIELAHMVAATGPQTTDSSAQQDAGMDAKRRGGIFGENVDDVRSNSIW